MYFKERNVQNFKKIHKKTKNQKLTASVLPMFKKQLILSKKSESQNFPFGIDIMRRLELKFEMKFNDSV